VKIDAHRFKLFEIFVLPQAQFIRRHGEYHPSHSTPAPQDLPQIIAGSIEVLPGGEECVGHFFNHVRIQ
jgi:hypothetical protein